MGAAGHPHNVGVITGVGYSGYGGYGGVYGGYRGYYGKREADSDAYTIGQVAYGLPVANAYATGHPHNVGVVTGVGYSGYGGVYYGKREADAYTLGQVAYGLPLANAYATGHPHNVGVVTGVGYGGHGVYYGKREAEAYTIGQVAYGGARGVVTGVDYGYGRVAGYGAVGNR